MYKPIVFNNLLCLVYSPLRSICNKIPAMSLYRQEHSTIVAIVETRALISQQKKLIFSMVALGGQNTISAQVAIIIWPPIRRVIRGRRVWWPDFILVQAMWKQAWTWTRTRTYYPSLADHFQELMLGRMVTLLILRKWVNITWDRGVKEGEKKWRTKRGRKSLEREWKGDDGNYKKGKCVDLDLRKSKKWGMDIWRKWEREREGGWVAPLG